jgi:hypothetical protein
MEKSPSTRLSQSFLTLSLPKFTVRFLRVLGLSVLLLLLAVQPSQIPFLSSPLYDNSHRSAILSRCRNHGVTPGPPLHFAKRTQSDRFVPGTPSTLLRNAKIWTGHQNGTEILHGDILLENGLIRSIGDLHHTTLQDHGVDLVVVDLNGSWVTPGLVDLHSHIGDDPSPSLGATDSDFNSDHGPILPWLRSLDGLNTHDDSYPLSISGGVTTALVLPGSGNNIGEYAYHNIIVSSLGSNLRV